MGPTTVGIDVGARSTRAIVLAGDGRIVARAAQPSGAFFARAAEAIFEQALAAAGIARDQVDYIATTGYGRSLVPFRDLQVTEMTSHGIGALHLFPGTRTVLDMGAQNTRVVALTPEGRIARFKMNDKCAAGAGRFLERVSLSLEVPLEQLGPLALQSREPQPISSVCAVLAESEVINLVSQEFRTEDILYGAHDSICDRIMPLIKQAGLLPEVTLTGGLVHNPAMVKVLRERLGTNVNCAPDGEYAGAIGAALLARRRWEKRRAAEAAGASPRVAAA
jgi:predicted CoA-substrate-specific enzyme activase